MSERPIVFVVDDDVRVRDALSSLLEAAGRDVAVFASAFQFLEADKPDAPAFWFSISVPLSPARTAG